MLGRMLALRVNGYKPPTNDYKPLANDYKPLANDAARIAFPTKF